MCILVIATVAVVLTDLYSWKRSTKHAHGRHLSSNDGSGGAWSNCGGVFEHNTTTRSRQHNAFLRLRT